MRFLSILLLPIVLCAAGCATGVRDLGEKERLAFDALGARLNENDAAMQGATTTLGKLGASYAEKEFALQLALAKAQRLEAMQAPWATTREELAATQRAVILYHLFEIELAEGRVLDARMAERREATRQLLAQYRQMNTLVGSASDNMEVILEHLNQPASAKILAATSVLLEEVEDFREELQTSENPRLQALAENVGRYEDAAARAREQAGRAINVIIEQQGGE